MSDHVREECPHRCGECNVCCLFCCAVCRAFEGGLTTECPGESYDMEPVYRGERDYFGGAWHDDCALNRKPS